MTTMTREVMEKLVSLCKRRGFIFQSSEIYGGLNGCWDYGPLGVELKRRIKDHWWRRIVYGRDDVVGMDASILMHPDIWRASGHVESFKDPMVDCRDCKRRFRADHVETEGVCPECGGSLTEPRDFNLMFRTWIGPVQEDAAQIYLRPETAQAIFAQFQTVATVSRQRVPFGIAQIGKSFRNEINPRNYIFRSREFEQMEMEFFVAPGEAARWMDYWVEERVGWYEQIGIRRERIRVREHEPAELAHYAKRCVDVEYEFPFGWQELEGIADRGDFDLSQHEKFSGKRLAWYDEAAKTSYVPHVVETSAGVDRTLLTVLADAYDEEEVKGDTRVVLRLAPAMAPVQVGVFPLVKKPELRERARAIQADLRGGYLCLYDESGAIGRRYRRQDEIGTPFCVTVDFETVEHQTVTIRHRDSMEQERIAEAQLRARIDALIGA